MSFNKDRNGFRFVKQVLTEQGYETMLMIFWEAVMIGVLASLIRVLLVPTELLANVEQLMHVGAVGS